MLFNLALFGAFYGVVSSIPAGPVSILLITNTVANGIKAGLIVLLALLLGQGLYIFIFGLGLHSYLIENKVFYSLLSAAGGFLLIAVGALSVIKTLKQQRTERPLPDKKSNTTLSGIKLFIKCFMITITNPAILFLFIAFLSIAGAKFGEVVAYEQRFWLMTFIQIGSAVWFIFIILLLSRMSKKIFAKFSFYIETAAGFIIALFGIYSLHSAYNIYTLM